MVTPVKEPVIEPNRLCEGRRAQIPSPTFCNNYLNCWDGWAVEQECPKGLLFSNQGYCDYSDNVNCEARKLSTYTHKYIVIDLNRSISSTFEAHNILIVLL